MYELLRDVLPCQMLSTALNPRQMHVLGVERQLIFSSILEH